MFSISVETRAGVTRHHLGSAIDALAIVEDIQKATNLPIVITNRARGHAPPSRNLKRLRKLRAVPCPPELSPLNDVGGTQQAWRSRKGQLSTSDLGPEPNAAHLSVRPASQVKPGAETHEIPSPVRPHRHPPHRRRGEDRAASLFPTLSRRSRKRARSSPWGLALRDESGKLNFRTQSRRPSAVWQPWTGTEVKIDGEDVLIMKESDVMGVIEERERHQEKGGLGAACSLTSNQGLNIMSARAIPHASPPTRATRCCVASVSSITRLK